VAAAIKAIGRTEDVQLSPDGRRIAIAGFGKNYLLVLDTEIKGGGDAAYSVHFGRSLKVLGASFALPHGIAWIDNELVIIANRHGQAPLLHIPRGINGTEIVTNPVHTIGATLVDYLDAPGSVALRHIEDGLVEVLICNNYSHVVSRHFLDGHAGMAVLASEIVFKSELNIPDGVVFSRTGKWVAVSNHYDSSVFIYRADQLGVTDKPAGVLRGIVFPHGITFTPDDRAIFVADAGAPSVYLYGAPDGDWSGDRLPLHAISVIELAAFTALNDGNPEDGGTKGVVLTADGGLLCVTCEQEPLFFYDVRQVLAEHGVTPGAVADRPPVSAPRLRELMLNNRRQTEKLGRELAAIKNSRAWQLVEKLRSIRRRFSRG
jgi:hypothetical protein